MSDVYHLGKLKYVGEVPEGFVTLRDNYAASPYTTSLEDRIVKLESGDQISAKKIMEPHEEQRQVSDLIEAVQDLIKVIAVQQEENVSQRWDTFGVAECAKRLGCSPGFVRSLVQEQKIGHIWLGKNLRFQDSHIQDFLASQAVARADKTRISSKKSSKESGQRFVTSQAKQGDPPEPKNPSVAEVKNLWR
jgi:excisionase family DNA binding protein